MSDFEDGYGEDEGLVPLFTLSPQQMGARTRTAAPPHEEPRAVFQRDQMFGYNVRLDDDFEPGAEGDDYYSSPSYASQGEGRRKMIGLSLGVIFLIVSVGLIALQPAAREAAGRFFGGSQAPQAAAIPTPTAHVLSIGSGATTPSPAPSSTPAPTVVPSAPPSTAPTPTGAPPVNLTGSSSQSSSGTFVTNCQVGRATQSSNECTWQVNIAAGNPLFVNVNWGAGPSLTLNITTASGTALNSGPQQSTSGMLSTEIPGPPATVFVSVSAAPGTSVTYIVSLASQP